MKNWLRKSMLFMGATILLLALACTQAPTATPNPTATLAPTRVSTPTSSPTLASPATPTPVPPPGTTATAMPVATPTPAPTAVPARKPAGKLVVALSSLEYEATFIWDGSMSNHSYWSPMYDFLFYQDDKGVQTPGLATGYEVSGDGKTWTLTIRKGVKFHDGKELDASDVKYTIDLLLNKESKHGASVAIQRAVASAQVLDKYRVAVQMKDVFGPFAEVLSLQNSIPIMSKEYVERVGIPSARERPVGTGPYKFVSRSKGDNIKFEAIDEHWRQVPYYKELEIKLVPEPSTRLALLRTGQADIVTLPLSYKKELQAAKVKSMSVQNMQIAYIQVGGQYLDGSKGFVPNLPWVDRKVREALNLAINREEISKEVFYGEATPAPMFGLMPFHPAYDPNWKPRPYDPGRARQLLKEAGYADGFELTLYVVPRSGLPDLDRMAEAVAMYWQAIGLKVKMVPADWASLRPKILSREFNQFATFSIGAIDPWTLADNNLTAGGQQIASGSERYPMAAELLKKGYQAKDPKEGALLLRSVYDIAYQEMVNVPVAHVSLLLAVNDKVGKWTVVPHSGAPNNYEYIAP